MEKNFYDNLSSHFSFQKKEWFVQRVLWVIMGVILVLGLIGLFGSGPISTKVIKSDKYSIEYSKYLRNSKASQLVVKVKDLGADTSLSINQEYVRNIRIDKIIPEPEETKVVNDRIIFRFSSRYQEQIVFYLVPDKRGFQDLILRFDNEEIFISQFVYY